MDDRMWQLLKETADLHNKVACRRKPLNDLIAHIEKNKEELKKNPAIITIITESAHITGIPKEDREWVKQHPKFGDMALEILKSFSNEDISNQGLRTGIRTFSLLERIEEAKKE